MSVIQRVWCPNRGDFADRQRLSDRQAPGCDHVVQTACRGCDYLMIMGFPKGNVLEAYAPGQASTQAFTRTAVSRWVRRHASTLTP